MTTKEVVHVVHYPGIHHGISTTNAFLRRLENQFNSTGQLVLVGSNQLSSGQANGHMPIMTAGMHSVLVAGGKALSSGTMGITLVLLHIITIHIKTEGHSLTCLAGFEHGHNASFATGHFAYQLRISTLADGTLHISGQISLTGYTHHVFFVHYSSAKANLIAQAL